MSHFVVDASVAVKWLSLEPLAETARELLRQNVLAAPGLLYAEVANALWSKIRRGEIPADFAPQALAVLRDAPITVPVGSKELAGPAFDLARDLDHPVYDCFYLALAIREQYPVVTADHRFYNAVRQRQYLASFVTHLEDAA